MDVVYLVRGYMKPTDKEKRILYNGKSPRKAFEFFEDFMEKAGIVVEIWEDGCFVKEFKK